MNPSRLLILALLVLSFAAPPARSQGSPGPDAEPAGGAPSAADKKKAAKLAEQSANFKKLPENEQAIVIDDIAFQESAMDEDIEKANIYILNGASLADLENTKNGSPAYRRCHTVISREKCVDKAPPPPTVKWIPREVELPAFNELFKDNEWEFLDGSSEAAELYKRIDKVVKAVNDSKGHIVSVHVEASANTLRNGGKAKNLTHEQLSKNRADAAVAAIKKYLADQKVAVPADENFTKGYKGENGNGTSGPSSPFKCPKGVDEKYCPKGDGAPPSLKEMLDYLNSQKDAADKDASSDSVLPAPGAGPGVEPAEPAPSVFQGKPGSKTLEGLKTETPAIKGPGAVSGGEVCTPKPTVWDLYPAYYYQFKYVRVSFVIDAPVQVVTSKPPEKDCKARMVLVSVSTHKDTPPPHRRPHYKKYRLRRLAHWFKCLFTPKGPCPNFECPAYGN